MVTRLKVFVYALFFALLQAPITAQSTFLRDTSHFPRVEQLTLNTPLRAIYVVHQERLNGVRADVFVLAGEADFSGPEGQSHYLEHLVGAHAADWLEGTSKPHQTDGNAFADISFTQYFSDGPPDAIETVLAEMRRVFETPDLTAEFMKSERQIVAREFEGKFAENPLSQPLERLRRTLLSGSEALALSDPHPLGRSLIGKAEDILAFKPEAALAAHERLYTPDRAVLVVIVSSGEQRSELPRLIEEQFGSLPNAQTANATKEDGSYSTDYRPYMLRSIPAQKAEAIQMQDPSVTQPYLVTSTLIQAADLPVFAKWKSFQNRALRINAASLLLSRWLNSRMENTPRRRLISQEERVDEVEFRVETGLGGRLWIQSAMDFPRSKWLDGSGPKATHDQVSNALKQVLQDAAKTGISKRDIERLRKRSLKSEERAYDDVGEYLDLAKFFITRDANPPTLQSHLHSLATVTQEEVQALLQALADQKVYGEIHAQEGEAP